jgi:hypothetical protein
MVLGFCRTFEVLLRDDLAVDSIIDESSLLGLAQVRLIEDDSVIFRLAHPSLPSALTG